MSEQYRYPGVTPFTRQQQHLFFGRSDALLQLYKLVQRESLVVLHGKSGLGKSSLINAGLLPRLEQEERLQPHVIRLGAWSPEHKFSPLITTKAVLPKEHPLLDRLGINDDALWYRAKALQLQDQREPLLIFDQFEELFSYPENEVQAFLDDLAELFYGTMPSRYLRSLDRIIDLSEEEEDLLEEPLRTRVLLSIRSDRLHLLERFKDYFPNILRNSYELQALSREAAREAIVQPATLAGNFRSAPFTYSAEVLEQLLSYLQDEATGRVEGILIQMLCEHYEKSVVVPQELKEVRTTDIGEPDMVVRDYYRDKIAALTGPEHLAARRLIEDGLVSEGEQGMRLSLHESSIENQYALSKEQLAKLVDQRLLRAEPFLRGGYTYELSHDRLLPAVIQARAQRQEAEVQDQQRREADRLRAEAEAAQKEKEKTRRQLRQVQILLAIALLALLTAGYLGYRSSQQSKALATANEAILEKQAESEKRLRDFEAADSLRKITEIRTLLSRATTYENLNQPELALRSLREALAIDSSRQDIRIRLEELDQQQNQ